MARRQPFGRPPGTGVALAALLVPAYLPAILAAAATPPPSAKPAQAAASAPLPSADELQAAYAAGRYDELLRKLQPVLALTGRAAEGYDRHALLRLRGEALLRTRAVQRAAGAFAAAAAVAPDPAAAATDRATHLLLQRSSAGATYQPRTRGDGKPRLPIGLLTDDGRREALRALFADEWAARRAEVEAAAAADVRRVDQLAQVAATVRQLRELELAANGDTAVVSDAVVGLDAKAANLLRAALDAAVQTIEDARAAAAQPRLPRPVQSVIRSPLADGPDVPVRLNATQAAAVRRAADACRDVARACDAFEPAFGGGAADFRGLRGQAEAHQAAAAALLGKPPPAPVPKAPVDARVGARRR